MHEEMHMTQMQFTNTGAREIVPFWDTTFGQHGTQHMFFRRRHGPSVGLFTEGDQRRNPRMMHMQKAQHGDVHSTTIFTNKYKQKGI